MKVVSRVASAIEATKKETNLTDSQIFSYQNMYICKLIKTSSNQQLESFPCDEKIMITWGKMEVMKVLLGCLTSVQHCIICSCNELCHIATQCKVFYLSNIKPSSCTITTICVQVNVGVCTFVCTYTCLYMPANNDCRKITT